MCLSSLRRRVSFPFKKDSDIWGRRTRRERERERNQKRLSFAKNKNITNAKKREREKDSAATITKTTGPHSHKTYRGRCAGGGVGSRLAQSAKRRKRRSELIRHAKSAFKFEPPHTHSESYAYHTHAASADKQRARWKAGGKKAGCHVTVSRRRRKVESSVLHPLSPLLKVRQRGSRGGGGFLLAHPRPIHL